MLIRLLGSAALGITVTTALLVLMNALIALGPAITLDERPRHKLEFVRLIRSETLVKSSEFEPERPAPPELPALQPNEDALLEPVTGIKTSVLRPADPRDPDPSINYSNSALVSIMRVQPGYPARAAANGTEGFVIVQFDVTPMGTVENVRVVESSHSVFNRSAIKAAERFRFRTPVVDGVPQPVRGVMNRFIFRMENG